MLSTIKKWFSKGDEDFAMHLPRDENVTFILKVDDIPIGDLRCENSTWIFKYTDEFKKHTDEYKLITGFPDLDKKYSSDFLWPFFRIRIPGLKQPVVQDILKEEHIDPNNEVALLKRFGHKTIANPYELNLN